MTFLQISVILLVYVIAVMASWLVNYEKKDPVPTIDLERQRLLKEANQEIDEYLWGMGLGDKPKHIAEREQRGELAVKYKISKAKYSKIDMVGWDPYLVPPRPRHKRQ